MNSAEIEAFLIKHRVVVTSIMRAIDGPGWRLSLRVPPGSPLHRPEVHPDDAFRIFVAPTLAGCWAAAKAAEPTEPTKADTLGAFG